ncbi:MAG TPA: hypothetical protein VFQ22_14020, partial [Longimicrobiales bacterium]|nr:hypothetical protein [Longimicrobiales bacterium]
ARDSDVKRKILELRPDFDEAELGFAKFSKFLAQAEEHGVVALARGEAGMEVTLAGGAAAPAAREEREERSEERGPERDFERGPKPERQESVAAVESAGASAGPAPQAERAEAPEPSGAHEPAADGSPLVVEVLPPPPESTGLRLGPRRGSTRRRTGEETVPLLEGQVIGGAGAREAEPVPAAPEPPAATAAAAESPAAAPGGSLEGLGLPTEPEAIVRYLAHRYKGVGEKTAEALVERYGSGLFQALLEDPHGVAAAIPAGRGEQLLEAWRADYERRTGARASGSGSGEGNGRTERNGGRRRGGRGRSRGRPRGE